MTPAGVSNETFVQRTGHSIGETRKATRAIAAHLRFAAIGVVVAHAEIGAVARRLDDKDAVRADAAMAIAQARDLFSLELQIPRRLSSITKSLPAPFILVKRSFGITVSNTRVAPRK